MKSGKFEQQVDKSLSFSLLSPPLPLPPRDAKWYYIRSQNWHFFQTLLRSLRKTRWSVTWVWKKDGCCGWLIADLSIRLELTRWKPNLRLVHGRGSHVVHDIWLLMTGFAWRSNGSACWCFNRGSNGFGIRGMAIDDSGVVLQDGDCAAVSLPPAVVGHICGWAWWLGRGFTPLLVFFPFFC